LTGNLVVNCEKDEMNRTVTYKNLSLSFIENEIHLTFSGIENANRFESFLNWGLIDYTKWNSLTFVIQKDKINEFQCVDHMFIIHFKNSKMTVDKNGIKYHNLIRCKKL